MHISKKYTCRIIKLILLIYFIYFISCLFSQQPSVVNRKASPEQVKNAVQQYTNISQQVFGPKQTVKLELTQKNVDDVLVAVSHMIPRVNFNGQMSYSMAVVSGSLDIGNRFFDGYINVTCILVSGGENGSIDSCNIGSISVPGNLVNGVIDLSLGVFFNDKVRTTINQLVNNIKINNQKVILTATKDYEFKNDLAVGLKSLASIVKKLKYTTNTQFPEPYVINEYLQFILESPWPSNSKTVSLGFVVSRAMEHAKARSQYNDPREENEAALWAIAIAFGNHRFAEIINANTSEIGSTLAKYPKVITTLRGRWDLPLHFLYSAIMERLGDSGLSVQVGELKELYDTNSGGTGFDFSDLAADKAGAFFSHYITDSASQALKSQNRLTIPYNESLFFPDINGLPKPIKGKAFDVVLGSTESERYKKQVEAIDLSIENLPLYR